MNGIDSHGRLLACCLLTALVVCSGVILARDGEQATSVAPAPSRGGTLVVALRAEPRTFNPITALDAPSREILRPLHADLVRIDRLTSVPEPALAESFTVSSDGRQLTVALRQGLRFSDGHACTADDVVFSFQVYLDPTVGSPIRDLLVVGGAPVRVARIDERRVSFTFAAPYGPAERLFDSIPILPRHVVEPVYRAGRLSEAWGLASSASLPGLGPFRLKEFVAGQYTLLERNPYYWRRDAAGQRFPYLDRLVFRVVTNEDALVLRLKAREIDLVGRVSPTQALGLESGGGAVRVVDAGPSLEFNFLLLNLNDPPAAAPVTVVARRRWFSDARFRNALSTVFDRAAMVRLAYRGRAVPIPVPLSPASRPWFDERIPVPTRSVAQAKERLRAAGYSWTTQGSLVDAAGTPVQFTILVASGNVPRQAMASIAADDLRRLGIRATVVPLEFRSLVERVTQTFDFDAAVMGLASGASDPAADMNVWLSTGTTHLWRMDQRSGPLPWEQEIDQLMATQLAAPVQADRKRAFDRVQAIAARELPVIPLVSPHLLAAVRDRVSNVSPSVLDTSVLWNSEALFWRGGAPEGRR
ncbi:MAG: ABC transporter substrate-binding protein [Vicinamibacterales bacterium]